MNDQEKNLSNEEQETQPLTQQTEEPAGEQPEEKKKGGFKNWWKNHKPTKRRLIQVYAALLYNVNFKGFFNGRIYSGQVKGMCVPGLNCYSCPGASGACPLGSLQNALAAGETPNAMFYVFGIIILFGLLLGRTICGFLCPVGLGQELLYKIKTPKLKKNKITYILSYFKYVLLAVLVIAVPLVFHYGSSTVIPGFCKYVCPAGTFGGAIGLLLHPNNADLYSMLGVLFTWKFIVMVVVIVACIFIYRSFCRFLCPLGAIYGFFNKVALLGVKLDKNKCTDCGLCIGHCKMDVKHVGDHECINCGECMSVCPAKAISWKGSKLLLHKNAVEAISEPETEERPLASVLEGGAVAATVATNENLHEEIAIAATENTERVEKKTSEKKPAKKRGRAFWLEVTAWVLALGVFAGAFVYYNFIDKIEVAAVPEEDMENLFSVSSLSGEAGEFTFSIHKGELSKEQAASDSNLKAITPTSGEGTKDSPFVITELVGTYTVTLEAEQTAYYRYVFTESEEQTTIDVGPYTYYTASADLKAEFYYKEKDCELTANSTIEAQSDTFTLMVYGSKVGDFMLPFDLEIIGGNGETYDLRKHRGKIVVVNFWYTTCGPCVEELPYFQQVAQKYGDEVEIVAIHKMTTTTDVVGFLETMTDKLDASRTWADWNITFLMDKGTIKISETYALLGGKDSYPMTVVVDENGYMTFHRQGSVTQEDLEAEIEKILQARA